MEIEGHADFSTEEGFRVIDDIASYSKPVVVLSGGEPLLREDVFDFARYGTEKGLRMCIATNGMLVTDEICEKMNASSVRMVSLSLDGSSEEVHDDFRKVKGAFAAVENAARLFNKHKYPFLLIPLLQKETRKKYPKSISWQRNLEPLHGTCL
jgi:MoaA/NifB/PqqE/SkfB family radical SAM enzyme